MTLTLHTTIVTLSIRNKHMLKLKLPYSSIYEEVKELLEQQYINSGWVKPTGIDIERDVDIIALKLAPEVLADREIWSCVVQDIQDMCLDHIKKQQQIFLQRSGDNNKPLQEKLDENDSNAGKLLLTMISTTICETVARECWAQIKKAEQEVLKDLREEKLETYGYELLSSYAS